MAGYVACVCVCVIVRIGRHLQLVLLRLSLQMLISSMFQIFLHSVCLNTEIIL